MDLSKIVTMDSNAKEDTAKSPEIRYEAYKGWINFQELALKDREFAAFYYVLNGHLDFKDAETQLHVTKALLRCDFDLKIDLPKDRLCPPVPNRWNYAHWVQSLLDSTAPDCSESYDPERKVIGLDIGMGASAIYMMLLLRSRPNWTMCGTDIDRKSFDSAARNLALNNLIARTKIYNSVESDPLIPLEALNVDHLDFVMCNPPFFGSEAEWRASISGLTKRTEAKAACTGEQNEMYCGGGELGFTSRIFEESLVFKEHVTWYTTMFGHYQSMKTFLEKFEQHGIDNFAVNTLDPGVGYNGTKRWLVAWSFGNMRPAKTFSRTEDVGYKVRQPYPTEHDIELGKDQNRREVAEALDKQLSAIEDLVWRYDPNEMKGIGYSPGNVWNREYRRRKKLALIQREKAAHQNAAANADDPNEAMAAETTTEVKPVETADIEKTASFVFKVAIEPTKVHLRWIRGSDTVVWESFFSLIDRAVRGWTHGGPVNETNRENNTSKKQQWVRSRRTKKEDATDEALISASEKDEK